MDVVKNYSWSGLGFGVNAGYGIAPNLYAMLGYNFQAMTKAEQTYKWKNGATDYNQTRNKDYATNWINLGLRPRVSAFAGFIYAGAGLALLLPVTVNQMKKDVAVLDATATIETPPY